jgi:hypothetical protein
MTGASHPPRLDYSNYTWRRVQITGPNLINTSFTNRSTYPTLYVVWHTNTTLWSSGQSSCPQIQRSGFDSWRYEIFWEVVGLERGPLNLVSTIEELLERKSSGSGLENSEYGRRDPLSWPLDTTLSAKVGTNFADNRRSLGLNCSIADTSHQVFFFFYFCWYVKLPLTLRKILFVLK